MNKVRKPLNQIMEKFDESVEATIQPTDESIPEPVDLVPNIDSLTSKLANPKKKVTKIRFTLDLDKPLDDLEQEWKQ